MGIVLDDKHKLIDKDEQKQRDEVVKKVNLISKQAISAMNKNKIIPTPENYKSYFENQLENRSSEEKKSLSELLANDSYNTDNYIATLEKDIQDAYLHIKKMSELIASSYSRLNSMRVLTKEINKNLTPTALVDYQEKLEQSSALFEKELKAIKKNYADTALLISKFSKNTIYDKKYGIHNKKHLLKMVEITIKNSEIFDYPNTLLAIRIKPNILQKIKSKSDRELLKVTLSKLLYKRSRRSDILAHYEDGIIMILLKHTDEKLSQMAIKRIQESVENGNFMVNGEDISLELEFGLSPITKDKIKEQVISEALDNLS